jgi:hypothetical protein
MLAGVAARVPRRALVGLLLADAGADGALMLRSGLAVGAWLGGPSLLVAVLAGLDRPAESPPRRGGAPWLSLACVAFLLVALLIVLGFDSPVFESYREALRGLDPDPPWPWVELAYARIAVGFSVHYAALALALRHPTSALLRWAMAAQLGWVLTDSATGLVHDAAFNVLMINVPSCLLFFVAWAVTWRGSGIHDR